MDFSHIPALKKVTILTATWTDCPREVIDEIDELWQNKEFGNDNHYYSWNNEEAETYPNIAAYLATNDITECLIHYWW